jgi:hypothetical protein
MLEDPVSDVVVLRDRVELINFMQRTLGYKVERGLV